MRSSIRVMLVGALLAGEPAPVRSHLTSAFHTGYAFDSPHPGLALPADAFSTTTCHPNLIKPPTDHLDIRGMWDNDAKMLQAPPKLSLAAPVLSYLDRPNASSAI